MEVLAEFLELVVRSKLQKAKIKHDELIGFINNPASPTEETAFVRELLDKAYPIIAQMNHRLDEVEKAIRATNSDVDSEWTLGLTYLGITTHYKQNDDGCICVRMEGILNDVGLLEQAVVIHEMDLFHEWIPFCKNSLTMTKLGPAELVGYLYTHLMPLGRDTAMRAYAVDSLEESNTVVIVGHSVPEWPPADPSNIFASASIQELDRLLATIPEENSRDRLQAALVLLTNMHNSTEWVDSVKGKDAPWVAKGWFHDRMDIKEFTAVMEMLSPTSAKTSFIASVDPRAHLPQTLVNFIIKNLAGMALYLYQAKVQKVAQHPDCSHMERMKSNPEFYRDWMLPKLREYFEFKGWPQPVVTVFDE